jgi:hypothetical protein
LKRGRCWSGINNGRLTGFILIKVFILTRERVLRAPGFRSLIDLVDKGGAG